MDSEQENPVTIENMIDKQKIPRHVAFIMDGNGRWAKQRGLPRTVGHKAGADVLRALVRTAGELGVKVLTAYAFSTENWKRSPYEVEFLMNLLDFYLNKEIDNLNKENVKMVFSGNLSALPAKVRARTEKAASVTAANTGLTLNLAINYGGRAEILRAVNNIIKDSASGKITGEVAESLFSKYLYTDGFPELDLLIRSGGDMRLSNFLLWQAAYAEMWFSERFWPDFTREDLCRAIYDYQRRDRRFGTIKDE
jgi:undecaprenyl diphosphate synthase